LTKLRHTDYSETNTGTESDFKYSTNMKGLSRIDTSQCQEIIEQKAPTCSTCHRKTYPLHSTSLWN
jgi:hypothetical protein